MVGQKITEIQFETSGRGFFEITHLVRRFLEASGITQGLMTLHIQHTSASLLIQENADPDVRRDLEKYFQTLVRDGDPMFLHTSEGCDDMSAHIRSALTSVNLSIPVDGGRLCLGTWQGIYVWEHRYRNHQRAVTLHIIGE